MDISKKFTPNPLLFLFGTLKQLIESEKLSTSEFAADKKALERFRIRIEDIYDVPRAFIVGEQGIGKSTLLNIISDNAKAINKMGKFVFLHNYKGDDFFNFLGREMGTKDKFSSDLVLCLSGVDEVALTETNFLINIIKKFVKDYPRLSLYISSTTEFVMKNQGLFKNFGEFKWIKLMPPYVDFFPDYVQETNQETVKQRVETEEPLSKPTEDTEVNAAPEYWWINVNPHILKINSLGEGEETYYSTHAADGDERKTYRYFGDMKPGDLAVGYEISPTQKLIAILKITKSKHTEGGIERISFKNKNFVDRQISRGELLEIPGLVDMQALRHLRGTLFKLTKEEFDIIVELTTKEEKGEFVPFYNMDGYTGVDKLDIEKDVDAFASLIAYKDLKPPLAVGLFGNWGAGKTFFMNRLEERVDELVKEDEENKTHSYCRDIVHVKFNAWHYSDANLWACLVINVFEELNKYAQKKGEGEVKSLKKILNEKIETSRIILKNAEEDVKRAKIEQDNAHDNYKKFAIKKKELSELLKGVITDSIAKELVENKKFEVEILIPLRESLGGDTVKDAKELKKTIKDIGSTFKRFFRSVKLMRNHPSLLLLALAIAVLAYVVPAIIIKIFLKETQIAWLYVVNYILPVLPVLLVPLKSFLRYFRKITQNFVKLTDFVNHEAEISQENVNIALENYKKAQENFRNANQELEDIKSGKRLMEFIEERSKSMDYNKHLGIVSIIRKDFEALKKELTLPENNKSHSKGFNIDRIILYIDDLDRCPKEKVVQVLEAIHLILALDLFVVVVGVDPRWVSKALYFQYSQLLWQQDEGYVLSKEEKEEYINVEDKATSIDYLGKIFQIPFVLKPIENQAKVNLLDHLFENQIFIEMEKTGKGVEEELSEGAGPGKPTETETSERQVGTLKIDVKKKMEKKKVEALEVLRISEDELGFMKFITPILGNTPRNIKRYANIYRIIRAHSEIPEFNKENMDDLLAIMFLLAIVVGNGPIASIFFQELLGAKHMGLLTFIESLKDSSRFKKSPYFQNLLYYMKDMFEGAPKSSMLQHKKICNLKIKMLRQYVPIVSRFSFRTIESV